MHMDPDQLQLIATHHFQRRRQVAVPDAMLAVLTAGIGFLAVAVTKSRLTRSQTRWPGDTSPSWLSMSIEPAFTGICNAFTRSRVASSIDRR